MQKYGFDNKKYYPLYTFGLTAALFLVILGLSGILGGGNNSIFRSDLFAQYITYIYEFGGNLKDNHSIWYSFSNYLGGGNVINVTYYVLSPFNLILLNPLLGVESNVILLIALKLALAAGLFEFYLQKCIDSDSKFNIIIALFYGLSGFSVAFHFNIMWLDVLYILPVLIWLISRFLKTGKIFALTLCYAYLFVTNFYTAYMAGIFSGLIFLFLLIRNNEYKLIGNVRGIIMAALKYIASVFMAVLLVMAMILPAFFYLMGHKAGDNSQFKVLSAGIADVLNSFFVGQIYSMNNQVPFLYCGVAVVGLAILFFISNKVDVKDKVGAMILLAIYTMALFIMPLYKFMHAFDYPDYYGFRFSFVIIFMLATMASFAYKRLEWKGSVLIGMASISAIFYSFMISYQNMMNVDVNTNSQNGLLINCLLIIFWCMLLKASKASNESKIIKPQVLNALALVLACVEIVVNGYIYMTGNDFKGLSDELFDSWLESQRQAESILEEDGSFYRVFVDNEICTNSGNMFGYNSLNTFSSSDNYDLRVALNRLGAAASNRMLSYNCNLPVFNSLYSVKYNVELPTLNDEAAVVVNNNENVLPLGYMVRDNIYNLSLEYNCFNNLNNICKAMTGLQGEVYTLIDEYDIDAESVDYVSTGIGYVVSSRPDSQGVNMLQFRTKDKGEPVYIQFYQGNPYSGECSPEVYADEYGLLNNNHITVGGAYKCNSYMGEYIVQIDSSEDKLDNYSIDGVYMASYNADAFRAVYEELNSNTMELQVYENDHIKGTVCATESKNVLFLSIPYDEAWVVYVDGNAVAKHTVVGNAFMAVELTPGVHDVELCYVEKGSAMGGIISILMIFAIAIWGMLKYIKKNKSNT